jgi:hypothetical protein
MRNNPFLSSSLRPFEDFAIGAYNSIRLLEAARARQQEILFTPVDQAPTAHPMAVGSLHTHAFCPLQVSSECSLVLSLVDMLVCGLSRRHEERCSQTRIKLELGASQGEAWVYCFGSDGVETSCINEMASLLGSGSDNLQATAPFSDGSLPFIFYSIPSPSTGP